MGPYVWCAVGALLGFTASRLTPQGFGPMVESILVGVFGAFIGGEFLPSMFPVLRPAGSGISPGTVAMAAGAAVVCLLLLGAMRRAVGPMKPHAKKHRS
jgi:uncharacterized membrane protein YeaQ/YmgE (transglycosylase-associated protein family)